MTVPALTGPLPPEVGPVPYLTRRQRQVLALAANGHTNQAIGWRLGTSEETVKSQMQTIRRRLHADDRAHAATVALRLGILSLADITIPPAIAHHHTDPK